MGLGILTSIFYSSEVSSQRKGRGEGEAPQSLNIGIFNVRGCSTNEVRNGEIGKTILRRRLDVCALNETKLKGKGELMGRVSGVAGGRARNGWRCICALCASQGYTRCFDRTSVYLCASPLQNLAAPQDLYFPVSISLERSG